MKYTIITLVLLLALNCFADSKDSFERIDQELSSMTVIPATSYYHVKKDEDFDKIIEKLRPTPDVLQKAQKDKAVKESMLTYYVEWLAKQYGAQTRICLRVVKTDPKTHKNLDIKKYPFVAQWICCVSFKENNKIIAKIYVNGKPE